MKVLSLIKTDNVNHYMPVIWLSLGDQMIIISKNDLTRNYEIPIVYLVAIFFLNTFVYKRLEASGRSFSIKSRIIIGMISATIAMCIAGTIEIFRQNACDSSPTITQFIGIYEIIRILFNFIL
jgi:hypothetical protein